MSIIEKLDNLKRLSVELNKSLDIIKSQFNDVEKFLIDSKLGIKVYVIFQFVNSDIQSVENRILLYTKKNGQWGLFISDNDTSGELIKYDNCTINLKIAAYNAIPLLLDKIVSKINDTIEYSNLSIPIIKNINESLDKFRKRNNHD